MVCSRARMAITSQEWLRTVKVTISLPAAERAGARQPGSAAMRMRRRRMRTRTRTSSGSAGNWSRGDFYYTGHSVYLDHGQGLVTSYFHLSEARVTTGQRVARGEVLGLAGDTGRSTRSHLHFGVSALGRLVDPGPLFLYDGVP